MAESAMMYCCVVFFSPVVSGVAHLDKPERERERERERQREREKERKREREKERKREREKERKREKRHIQTDRHTHT